ncbi:MAG: HAD-IIB family hydrolase [Marinobacter sp.]|uniref:HAD-IIB family hydrolase n=1 Tax=Marinobacter sp. TaxID=50741 RepID=UPI003298DA81
MKQLLIVTDLDGSLLDHDDYSFAAAVPALATIWEREYPLILASSKTREEMLVLQQQLDICYPFICENGAAICTPLGPEPGAEVRVEALAPQRSQVLALLTQLRDAENYRFTGFSDCNVDEIAAMTGLEPEAAALAAAREYSEPLLWQDTDERLAEFRMALAQHSMQAMQGGRFLSVAGCSDKAVAMQKLRERYGGEEQTTIIALGDSPNDESMLAAADIAVIIRSARSASLHPHGPDKIVRTTGSGPRGWQEAMSMLFESMHQANGES